MLSDNLKKTAHDHRQCLSAALLTAERVCAERDLRLTPIRRQVLAIVWNSHEPVGAYQILALLPRSTRAPAPMTVYRALEFLVEAGLVHRVDSLNAFIGCPQADANHKAQLLVCRSCHGVQEVIDPGVGRALARSSEAHGFAPDAPFEIKGLCRACDKGTPRPSKRRQSQPRKAA